MNVPLWVAGLTVLLIAVLLLVLWSLKRRRRPHLRITHMQDEGVLMQSMAGLTLGSMATGNAVRLLQNGRFFDELHADIARARATISLETFLAKEGEVTRRLAAALAQKARAGVQVRVMLDGWGGRKFGREPLRLMREAGCTVRQFHPIRLSNLGRLNNRTHRKIVVIDGRIGYVGGHCLADNWLGDGGDREHFRDISARVEGPVVAQLQSAFTDNWITEAGEVAVGEGLFPVIEPAGDAAAHAVYVSPAGNPSTIELLHYGAIEAARRRLLIQNPYFLPDGDARDALARAVGRGVEVRIMIPAATVTDSPIVQHASHHHYGSLLKDGVRIFEYQRSLLHQKVLVIDGQWAAVGSSNFDDRSFEINDEVALVVYDEALAGELETIFREDLEDCIEQRLDEWQRRPALHKLQDGVAFLFKEQL